MNFRKVTGEVYGLGIKAKVLQIGEQVPTGRLTYPEVQQWYISEQYELSSVGLQKYQLLLSHIQCFCVIGCCTQIRCLET